MPLYEYQCDSCGARFERIQKFSDAPVSECPTCGQGVRKLISSPAIQFKGSGWYITDYAKGNSTAAAAGKTNPSGESNGSGAASTAESTPKPSSTDTKAATPTTDSGAKDKAAPAPATKP